MRRGIMLAQPFETKFLQNWPTPWLCQPKHDGLRCRGVWDSSDGSYNLFSSEGNPFMAVPHINKALTELQYRTMFPRNFEFDGELYIHGTSAYHISHLAKRDTPLEDSITVQYHIFDLIPSAGTPIPQNERLSILEELRGEMAELPMLHIVPTRTAFNMNDVDEALEEYLTNGYEGFILRHPRAIYHYGRTTNLLKFKPSERDEYTVVGFQEEVSITGVPKDTLGSLWLQDSRGERFSCGSGLTNANSKQLWQERGALLGRTVVVKYQCLTPDRRVPRHPVFMEIK